MVYDRQQRMQMLELLIEAGFNAAEARRRFQRRFPNQPCPSRLTFHRLGKRYREHGDVEVPAAPRARPVRDAIINILQERFEGQRGIQSARRAAVELGYNRETVRQVLKKDLQMHPYHVQIHQELQAGDPLMRLRFARWITLKILVNENFPTRILFTDESTFTNKGTINKQNMRYWAPENPRWKIDKPSRGFKINVWAGVLGVRIIGPYFFEENLTGQVYGNFLQNEFQQLLPADERHNSWFMQDGAPAHTTSANIKILRRLFHQRVISRGTQHQWPPRSPDLTPLDFFVWPFVKERVYATAPATIQEMCQRINEVFGTITPAMLRNVRRSFVARVELCIENNGHHVEHKL